MRAALYGSTAFLSALLLLSVQPMAGKRLLPWFGGSPGVWSTCLLFFQAALFLGYALAHGVLRRAGARGQLAAVAVLLGAAIVALPIGPAAGDRPAAAHGDPAWQLLQLLGLHVGLPYLALAATAPLVQAFYERATARSPYPLYAWSNAGSLLGLLAYPFAVEPLLSLDHQARAWSALFMVFAAGLFAAGASALRGAPAPVAGAAEPLDAGERAAPPERPLLWLALSAIASVLLVSGTNYITVDVAAGPLLWVVPLALYLLTFVIAFGMPALARRALLLPAWCLCTGALGVALFAQGTAPLAYQLTAVLGALFSGCLLCHAELFRLRPAPARLSRFYLMVSLGGAAGGLLVALIAPRLFRGFFELQLAVLAAYAVVLRIVAEQADAGLRRRELRWLWLGCGLSLSLIGATVYADGKDRTRTGRVIEQRRNFFGVLRVTEFSVATALTHGRIRHGLQFRDPARRREPTSYYAPTSGAGRALLVHAAGRPRRIGVIGLGVGTLAAYGRAGDRLRFYELDRDVVELARTRFTYLKDAEAAVEIAIGDGRILLEREPPHGFDLLFVDAFSSDAVPAHLLTVEAFRIYLRHLRPDGVLLVNVANRHLAIARVVAGAAGRHGLSLRVVDTPRDDARGHARARWALLARRRELLDAIVPESEAYALRGPKVVWTDAFGDLLSVLR